MILRYTVLIVCLVMLTPAAFADGSAADVSSVAQARTLYESGKAHYNLGEYGEALDDFKRAYRLRQDAAILFNIAQCHRMLGQFELAARYYRTFKRELPDDRDSSAVDRLIADMDKAVQERSARQPPTGTKPPAPVIAAPSAPLPVPAPDAVVASPQPTTPMLASTPRSSRRSMIAGSAVAAVGVVSLAGGVVAGVLAQRASDDINAAARAMQPFDPSKQAAGHTAQLASDGLFTVGAVAVVSGVVLLALGRREQLRARAMTLTSQVGPHAVAATIQGRF